MTLLEDIRAIAPAAQFGALLDELNTLPPSLMLARRACARPSPAIVKQKRGIFTREIRAQFLRHVGEYCADELRAMGITEHGIAAMREYGEFPQNTPGERLDCTVDHVESLSCGGENDIDNMVLVPARINAQKDRLEQLQVTAAQAQGAIITIVPATPGKVPFIPGGFQRARKLTS